MSQNLVRPALALLPLLVLAASMVGLGVSRHAVTGVMFNDGDAMFLPVFIPEFLRDPSVFADWYLPPPPFVFPDWFLFAIATVLFPQTLWRILAFSVIQMLATYGLLVALGRTLRSARPHAGAALGSTAIILLSVVDPDDFYVVWTSAFHYGSFLASLLILTLSISILSAASTPRAAGLLAAMAAAVLVSAFSDPLVILQAAVPIALAALLIACRNRVLVARSLTLSISAICSSWLGLKLYSMLIPHNTRYQSTIYSIDTTIRRLNNVDLTFRDIFSHAPMLILMLMLPYIWFGLRVPRLVRVNNEEWRIRYVVMFCLASAVVVILALPGFRDLGFKFRYTLPVILWPTVVGSILIFRKDSHEGNFFRFGHALLLGTLASTVYTSLGSLVDRHTSFTSYPDDVRCVDDVLGSTRSNKGVSSYWNAKYLQAYSRANTTLAQFHRKSPGENRWITSERYFAPRYDFVVASLGTDGYDLKPEYIEQLNGPPVRVAACGTRRVMVYEPGTLRVR